MREQEGSRIKKTNAVQTVGGNGHDAGAGLTF